MSKILSYSDNTSGSDWISKEPYSGDDINKIKDPNAGQVEYPRTAIPSPFAQLDLVNNAFAILANNPDLQGALMHQRLVSNALDVAQLLFDFANFNDKIRIIRWNPRRQTEIMLQSDEHRLLGQTLLLFMESDKAAYNFDLDDDWNILTFNNIAIGSTSPVTLTMGVPMAQPVAEIMLEEGIRLFDNRPRHLWERDEDFVVYLIHYFNAFPLLRQKAKAVYDYILTNLEIIRDKKPELYNQIINRVANPHALGSQTSTMLAETLGEYYNEFEEDPAPRVLGFPLYCRKVQNIFEYIDNSDFKLLPNIDQNPDDKLPLVLRTGFVAPGFDKFTYINRPWKDSTIVLTNNLPIEERQLPETSISYPWITTSDLLEDAIIELGTPIDKNHYFDGNASHRSLKTEERGFLLPIKPLFFKYFNAAFLSQNIVPGKRVFEMRCNADNVVVILRVPVKKSYVEFTRTYRRLPEGEWSNDEQTNEGYILPANRLSVSIFPFARTNNNDLYNIQLFEMIPDFKVSIDFFKNANVSVVGKKAPHVRTQSRIARTSYYEIDDSFDYIRATIDSTDGRFRYSGVILPLWQEYRPSTEKFRFAVDFGTTNSHVEYTVNEMPPKPLTFDKESAATLVASLAKHGSLAQNDTYLDIEFLPAEIGELYGFPLRTALSENEKNDAYPEVLQNINIPFLYERKAFNGYHINTLLKWADDTLLAEQFLREIMLLIRARVILSNGDLKNVKIIYFYPVSMKKSLQNKFLSTWESLFQKYISHDEIKITALPESIAPAFYYNNAGRDGSNFVSVDIGGGTSDLVIYKADEEGLTSNLDIITSFRFAGNTIFGDGFTKADSDHNRLIEKYVKYFYSLVDDNPNLSYLNVILSDILESKKSEDINAFLFSIEKTELIRTLSPIDRKRYSYNALLGDDATLKIVFVYFYASIIYYIAKLMIHNHLEMPKQIYFSGTGSKILNILGRTEIIEQFTQDIIEAVYGEKYKSNYFELKMEKESPKQITCKGGLMLGQKIEQGDVANRAFSFREIMSKKQSYTLTDDASYSYSSIRNRASREKIELAVEEFNRFFIDLMTKEQREEFGISQNIMTQFSTIVNADLPNYLAAGIQAFLPLNEGEDETVEDVPFFYPITGIIRNTLLQKLVDDTTDNN